MNCKAMTPILDGLKSEYADINFTDVNTSERVAMADKYDISTLPTIVFEKDGAEVGRAGPRDRRASPGSDLELTHKYGLAQIIRTHSIGVDLRA